LFYFLPEFESDAKKFVLTDLLGACPDFKYEKSAMQKLAEDLSVLHSRKVELLITPKYHCELAGEGIEYGWGLFKKDFRRTPHAEKKGRERFETCVKRSLKRVIVEHIRRFSARARRYMLTYMLLDSPESLERHGLSYHEIEQYVTKKMKVHRNTADQESAFIAQVWRESQKSGEKTDISA